MFANLIYNEKKNPIKDITKIIKDGFISQYNHAQGIYTHLSNEFVDVLNVERNNREVFYSNHDLTPEEALQAFINDDEPGANKLRDAQVALMNHFDEIKGSIKVGFFKHFSNVFGINSLIANPNGSFMTLALMMFILSDEEEEVKKEDKDDMSMWFVLLLLLGMNNEGPDQLKEFIKKMAKENEDLEMAMEYIREQRMLGLTRSEILEDVEHRLTLDLEKKQKIALYM